MEDHGSPVLRALLAAMPDAGKTVDTDAVMALCKERLAKFKVPKNIIVMDMLPFTRIGKVDRPTLKKMLESK